MDKPKQTRVVRPGGTKQPILYLLAPEPLVWGSFHYHDYYVVDCREIIKNNLAVFVSYLSGCYNMTIEQVLMKMMKVQGGLTRGRGITDTTGILHLCSSSLLPNHGGSREPIRHIVSILRAACGLQGSQGTPTSTPEQGCHRSRQVHQLSMAHHLQRSSMVAIYSMWWFGQPLSHIKLSSIST